MDSVLAQQLYGHYIAQGKSPLSSCRTGSSPSSPRNGEATDVVDRLRPSTVGAVRVTHVHNGTTQPFNRGHAAGFAPGGSLYFAGEHCGKLHAGLRVGGGGRAAIAGRHRQTGLKTRAVFVRWAA